MSTDASVVELTQAGVCLHELGEVGLAVRWRAIHCKVVVEKGVIRSEDRLGFNYAAVGGLVHR